MKLAPAEIDRRLQTASGWSRQGDALERQFEFNTFVDAITFVVRLAFEAEAADHHPDLRISYRKVNVSWSTHSADGITEKDFDGVERCDRLAAALPR